MILYIQFIFVNVPSMETSQMLLRLACFSFDFEYLPPQGFGPEAKTRGGIIEPPA